MGSRSLGALSLLILFMTLKFAFAAKGRITSHELSVDGIKRSYILYEPDGYTQKDLPLMIVLHGGLGNAESIMENSGMNDIANSGRFVVAYPNGVPGRFGFANRRTWNAGGCCGRAAKNNVDDVKFLKEVIENIGTKISIDKRRVYVAGMSNGAMMAYRLAAEIPERIAAVIAVSGALTINDFDSAKNIPVMIIHGTEDENVPISGGSGAMSLAGVSYRPLADTVKLIIRSRQCLAPVDSTQNGRIRVSSYRCSKGAPVVVVVVIGGGHAWPGGRRKRYENTSDFSFSASKQSWEFAQQFSKTSN